jgi:hypothetical protein
MRRLLLLLPLAFLLPACAYTSPVPLGDPASAPLDEALVGDWVGRAEEGGPGDSATIRIRRFNQHEYLVEWDLWECQAYRPPQFYDRRLRVFITAVDSVRFLNIQDIQGDTAYWLARYTASASELRLRFIGDHSDGGGLGKTYDTPLALRAAVRAKLNDKKLYTEEVVLVRPTAARLTIR